MGALKTAEDLALDEIKKQLLHFGDHLVICANAVNPLSAHLIVYVNAEHVTVFICFFPYQRSQECLFCI